MQRMSQVIDSLKVKSLFQHITHTETTKGKENKGYIFLVESGYVNALRGALVTMN